MRRHSIKLHAAKSSDDETAVGLEHPGSSTEPSFSASTARKPSSSVMADEDDREAYEESLSAWRARLKAPISAESQTSGGHSASTQSSFSTDEKTPLYSESAISHSDSAHSPLIGQVTNKWRDEKYEYLQDDAYLDGDHDTTIFDLEYKHSCPSFTIGLGNPRLIRRMIYTFLALCTLVFCIWTWVLAPAYAEEWEMKQGFLRSEDGTYGLAKAGDFQFGKKRIQTLDKKLIPGGSTDPKGKRRLIFVGDIHGCKTELLALLEAVGFNQKTDHLVATGDTISKGPDNAGVLDELIRIGATSVRGNHEDRLITTAGSTSDEPSELIFKALSKGATKDAALLKQLKRHHLNYLHSMPLVLRIPPLPQAAAPTRHKDSAIAEEILVVHAGLVPSVPLEEQDPYFVMNMRSMHARTHVPSAERASDVKHPRHQRPWIDLWNWYNDHLYRRRSIKGFRGYDVKAQRGEDVEGWAQRVWLSVAGSDYRSRSRPKPQTVIYGHDSKAGVKLRRFTKGLDSGCVKGGELTALILDAHGKWETVSVGCEGIER